MTGSNSHWSARGNTLMPLRALLLLLALLVTLSCGRSAPTPDIQTIVESAVASALPTLAPTPTATPTPAPTPDVEAIVAAAIEASHSTPVPTPTPTSVPTIEPTPTPPPPTPLPTPYMEALVSAAAAAVAVALPTPVPTPLPTPTPTLAPTRTPQPSLVEMLERVRPAVVRIDTDIGMGSGIIFERDGHSGAYVVTNHHVVEDAGSITVTVDDAQTYAGQLLGTHQVHDLAVVRICCGTFVSAPFGDTRGLQPGTEVVAVGYALGIFGEATVTRGIVSAIRYDYEYGSWVIQTDAPINPGNSGGPVFSRDGAVLGINTFKAAEIGVEGLGFALDASLVQSVLPQLMAATPTPTPRPTPRPTPTPTPRPTPIPTSTPVWTSDFGPVNGELRHDPNDERIKGRHAYVTMADFILEATFVNPYDRSDAHWDYGFTVRNHGAGRDPSFILITVSDTEVWSAAAYEYGTYHERDSGWVPGLATRDRGRNHLMLIAMEGRGLFFVNGNFVASLDLGDIIRAGDVAVVTGTYADSEVAGEVTRYEGFRVDRLTKGYGPIDGIVTADESWPDHVASGTQPRNFVAESRFTNPLVGQGQFLPYGFHYGFIFRSRWDTNLGHHVNSSVSLSSRGEWSYSPNDYDAATRGDLPVSLTWPGSDTHVVIIALDNKGWLLADHQLIASLDLSQSHQDGEIAIWAWAPRKDDGNWEPINYDEFTVWVP